MEIFETFKCSDQNSFKFLMSIFKWQVNSCPNFASFFIFMAHNFSVDFKLIVFLFWIKGFHQSPNFEAFKCSGENLLYSLCHFPNNKSVFLQILRHPSMSWKSTLLYFFRSNIKYFARFVDFWMLGSNFTKFLSFLKEQIRFSFRFCINLHGHEI